MNSPMQNINERICSVRIVSVDSYMKTPIFGVDPCYSEFRGNNIKQVPVIRIFGTDGNGVKTCAHVHGVFPYLYIPYSGGENAADADRLAYQLASSLDKAINISLGQTNSSAQHIFKIIMVKGIPFYGYHRNEHKFLKIFLYNPAFVRRTANLLQNGAILGRIYQPHESHVPYILQFFIDFNLYGMSFLYVPAKTVRYRQRSCELSATGACEDNEEHDCCDDELLKGVDRSQILDKKYERMSTSKQEIDVIGAFILNRIQVPLHGDAEHANPGIAFIWSDERGRRSKMEGEAPPLVVSQESSQCRNRVLPTESEIFHQTALDKKIEQIQSSCSDTTNISGSSSIHLKSQPGEPQRSIHRKFNLNQFLQNSVYPAECAANETQEIVSNILNASHLIDHLHASSGFNSEKSIETTINATFDEFNNTKIDLDETIVDEELVLSLTQKPMHNTTILNETLNADEHEVLNILELLEQQEFERDEEACIDNDSLLAPSSQNEQKIRLSQSQRLQILTTPQQSQSKCLEKNVFISSFAEEDSDDDLLNEFSMSLLESVPTKGSLNVDESAVIKIPQYDGAFDTPIKKLRIKRHTRKVNGHRTPSRNPCKYAPLDITISKSPSIYSSNGLRSVSIDSIDFQPKIPKLNFEQSANSANEKVLSSTIVSLKLHDLSHSNATPPRWKPTVEIQSKNGVNIQPTQASDIRSMQSKRLSENEVPSEFKDIIVKKLRVRLIKDKTIENRAMKLSKCSTTPSSIDTEETDDEMDSSNQVDLPRRYPKRARNQRFHYDKNGLIVARAATIAEAKTTTAKKSKNNLNSSGGESDIFYSMYSTYKWSKCELAKRYDTDKYFFPEPGPSTINYYENDYYHGYSASSLSPDKSKTMQKSTSNTPVGKSCKLAKIEKTTSSDYVPPPLSYYSDCGDNDIMVQSFYDQNAFNSSTMANEKSPDMFILPISEDPLALDSPPSIDRDAEESNAKSLSTPLMSKFLESVSELESQRKEPEIPEMFDEHIIEPDERPPSPCDVIEALTAFNIPQCVHPVPFYSDLYDVAAANMTKKEIGNTVLQLGGISINDCVEFESQLRLVGFNVRLKLASSDVTQVQKDEKKNKSLQSSRSVRALLASDRIVTITPATEPPTTSEAFNWLNARRKATANKKCTYQAGGGSSTNKIIYVDYDSPIKIRRETPKTMFIDSNVHGMDLDVMQANKLKRITSNVSQILSIRFEGNQKNDMEIAQHSCPKTSMVMHDENSADSDVICLDDCNDENNENNNRSFSNQSMKAVTAKRPKETGSYRDQIKKISQDILSTSQLDKKLERPSFVAELNLEDTLAKSNSINCSFGITGATMENSFGFKMDLENFQCAKSNIEHNYLTILSLEIHCQTRIPLLPDPVYDEIACIFYAIHNDVPDCDQSVVLPEQATGVIINICQQPDLVHHKLGILTHITYVNSEVELLMELVRLVRIWDPDIFAGYEIEMASWGYIMQRSQVIDVNLVPLLSRIPTQKVAKMTNTADDDDDDDAHNQAEEFFGQEYRSEYKLYGRILLDVWRLLRSEIALTSYSFENIMYHVLHRRYALYTKDKLTRLWSETTSTSTSTSSSSSSSSSSPSSVNKWIVIEYYLERVSGTLEILGQLDLVGRTCELAKLFGIQFYEVLSRGSQFRVESMMLRIAKPKNLIPVSPSVQQRAHMRAPEYLPLILEPHSRFYSDPLIVLDFQSLYPSMIIAYNYCFSTCLGRVEHLGESQPFEFGASQLRIPRDQLEKLNRKRLIHISPCGAVFVKSSVREGVLPRMLREILDTRLMVKQSMKLHKHDKLLQRVLHSRQLGLKLMANVTYGYTAANFSGRMPCVEVGDSVVSKGRETLERAIKTVEANERWRCRVVYGDTDSLFVLVPGRSRAEAFRIGGEIAETITNENPFPVRLKLEKVYHPSILQTKKRYVGYMYESAEQNEPVYEAKGIETVRRDGCPAVAKMLEKTLRILFETCDLSAVKRYICRQFTKILSGHANTQDLIFAKEFRGVNGYKPSACVPALELTRAAMQIDRRDEPRRGERVPYLVVNGPPGLPLIRLVRKPHEYLSNEGLKINAMYYITKVLIPPLNRCLLLIGADVSQWFADLPRKSQYLLSLDSASNVMSNANYSSNDVQKPNKHIVVTKKSTISQYFSTTNCVCDCGGHTRNGICSNCLQSNERRQLSAIILSDKCMQLERKLNLCSEICASCCGQCVDIECASLDCSVLFMLNRWKRDSRQIQFYRQLLDEQF